MINYLRVSDIEVGLVLNFGPKAHYIRRVMTNDREIPVRVGLAEI